jgi:6-pyruvoyltetrahydropterin/6-carboxytetrahydropterin synthase
MFSVHVTTSFNAVHAVTIRGEDETPHSHNWKVEVVIEGETLDEDGVLIDFLEVEGQLETIIEPLAESNLNTIDTLESTNPSAERIAQYVGDALSKQIRGNVRVQSVTITEATNCKATYSL